MRPLSFRNVRRDVASFVSVMADTSSIHYSISGAGGGLRDAAIFGYIEGMEVNLPPEVETKLARLANQRGIDAQALACRAIESFVDYDDWFIREVEKGLAQIDRGEVLPMKPLPHVSRSA